MALQHAKGIDTFIEGTCSGLQTDEKGLFITYKVRRDISEKDHADFLRHEQALKDHELVRDKAANIAEIDVVISKNTL